MQSCIHREISGATSAMVGRICPPGWNGVKVSENLGADRGRTGRPCGYIAALETSATYSIGRAGHSSEL